MEHIMWPQGHRSSVSLTPLMQMQHRESICAALVSAAFTTRTVRKRTCSLERMVSTL